MPKNQPPTLISPPKKHHWRNGASSNFSAKMSETITSPGSEAECSLKLLFSTFNSTHSLCLLWFLNQLNWDKSELRRVPFRGEKWQQSLGKYWNRRITSKLDQSCLMSSWQCISHRGTPISQTKWAWCVSFRVRLPQSSRLVLQAAAHTVSLIQRKHLHIVRRNTVNSPRNMLKAKQALFPPSHFRLQFPWQRKFTFMRREISDDLMSFSSMAFRW